MNKSYLSLPGIRRIGWVEAKFLPDNIVMHDIVGLPVLILTEINDIDFFGVSSCVCKSNMDEGTVSQTATLKFKSMQIIDDRRDIAFIVTDMNGDNYLIGNSKPPFAKIHFEKSTGQPDSEPAVIEYEITHCNVRTMVLCNT